MRADLSVWIAAAASSGTGDNVKKHTNNQKA
jgi:hypothetical protein